MAKTTKSKNKTEFGDFQTPIRLVLDVCRLLSQRGLRPVSILEPTCGLGNFLIASIQVFPNIRRAVGIEINQDYVVLAGKAIAEKTSPVVPEVRHGDFFRYEWTELLSSLPDPLLIIGNPPWVTNSKLGSLSGVNLPLKSNIQNYRGIDAITGKSNFDISEWMLIKSLEWIKERKSTLAMLCKSAVARKALLYAWKSGIKMNRADIYRIDAAKEFGVAVEACLLVIETSLSEHNFECQIHNKLEHGPPSAVIGYRNNQLVADVDAYERLKGLEGKEWYQWRSGVKHDCSRVMEFIKEEEGFRNGIGERVKLEDEYMYPMLKSSDIASGSNIRPHRWMLVTQRFIGENTSQIRDRSPKTWQYLKDHADLLDRRAGLIYRKKPRYSIFGVGEYSFSLWKVAISGFYKKLNFKVAPPHKGKPVLLDDTCYFLPCESKEEAQLLSRLLNSRPAQDFFSSLVFWDSKRPITVALLRRLDIFKLAKALDLETELILHLKRCSRHSFAEYKQALSSPR